MVNAHLTFTTHHYRHSINLCCFRNSLGSGWSEILRIDVADQAERLKDLQLIPVDIKFLPRKAVLCRTRICVVIIVPAFAKRDCGDKALLRESSRVSEA